MIKKLMLAATLFLSTPVFAEDMCRDLNNILENYKAKGITKEVAAFVESFSMTTKLEASDYVPSEGDGNWLKKVYLSQMNYCESHPDIAMSDSLTYAIALNLPIPSSLQSAIKNIKGE